MTRKAKQPRTKREPRTIYCVDSCEDYPITFAETRAFAEGDAARADLRCRCNTKHRVVKFVEVFGRSKKP